MMKSTSENNIYLLAELPDRRFHAGEKARNDVVNILKNNGIEHVLFYQKGNNKLKTLLDVTKSMGRMLFKLKENDIVIAQYPYYPVSTSKVVYNILDKITNIKKAKKIMIIHDLNCFRNIVMENEELDERFKGFTKEIEINILSKFDAIIAHNSVMANELAKSGINSSKIVELGIFDYLYNKEMKKQEFDIDNIKVVIAGNLEPAKSGYISGLAKINLDKVNFELYGPNYKKVDNDNIHYNGMFPPEELCEKVNGNFGLVWDGQSLEKCDGISGRYLRYNNPHKASLYITCGIPLIVWKESAIAKFVESKGIGVLVDNLNDLENILSSIDENQYKTMVENLIEVRKDIVKGGFLTEAINKGLQCVNK